MTTITPQGGAMPRLSIMMFLQYAVWGLWLPVIGNYLSEPVANGGLGFNRDQMLLIVGLGASVGAITAPFIAGQFADRYFRAERFLAFLLAAGGTVQIILAQQTSYTAWIVFIILYSILFMPTLSLTNSIAFAHLNNPTTQFPKVRVLGTFGWIAASWLFPLLWLLSSIHLQVLPPFYDGEPHPESTKRLIDAMTASGILSILYAVYCFLVLPATPPKKEGVEAIAFAKAFRLLQKPSVLCLVLASLTIAAIHQVYFMESFNFFKSAGMPEHYIMPAMSAGQFAEILAMAILGFLLKNLGFRWVITIGALSYFGRYIIWSMPGVTTPILVASQMFHGLCYACFIATSFIYIDRVAPRDIKNSAQTVIGIMILGAGPLLASFILPIIMRMTGSNLDVEPQQINFQGMWRALAIIGLVVAVLFVIFFRDEKAADEPEAAEA